MSLALSLPRARPAGRMRLAAPRGPALAVYLRSLAVMYNAGIRLDRSLRMLGEQAEDPTLKLVSEGLWTRLQHGESLSQAVAHYPEVFPEVQRQLIKVGELTGGMSLVLQRLALYEERRRALALRVKSALTYPAFLFFACTLMLLLGPPLFLRSQLQLLRETHAALPILTRALMAVSDLVTSPWTWVVLVPAGWGALARGRRLRRDPRLHLRLLRMPGLGRALRSLAAARFARALGVMLSCGSDISLALVLAARTSGNPVLERRMLVGVERLQSGWSLVGSLRFTGFFDRLFLETLRSGEEAGCTPETVSRLADQAEEEVDTRLDLVTRLAEPFVMVVMGVSVGLVVVAVMLPMAGLLNSL